MINLAVKCRHAVWLLVQASPALVKRRLMKEIFSFGLPWLGYVSLCCFSS
jgi:hypothetical protein